MSALLGQRVTTFPQIPLTWAKRIFTRLVTQLAHKKSVLPLSRGSPSRQTGLLNRYSECTRSRDVGVAAVLRSNGHGIGPGGSAAATAATTTNSRAHAEEHQHHQCRRPPFSTDTWHEKQEETTERGSPGHRLAKVACGAISQVPGCVKSCNGESRGARTICRQGNGPSCRSGAPE